MRRLAWLCALAFSLLLASGAAEAADRGSGDRTRLQLEALNNAVDELNSPRRDVDHVGRATRGEVLNQAFVALTGEAVNPLFGVTAMGIYNYAKAPDHLREHLPIYDQPIIWGPLLAIILLMLFNSTICEAVPFLKVPLNALGDIVNKAGAVAVLPLVVKMFADAVAQPAAEQLAGLSNTLFPVAHAGGGGAMETAWLSLGWVAGALVGFVVYASIWLTFNVVDVLILVCPFPGIDALLKSLRLAIIGVLAGTYHLSPTLSLVLAIVLTLVCLPLAGWSFRLSVFGLIFSTDILFLRKGVADGGRVRAFAGDGLAARHGVPMRSWGWLERDRSAGLVFSYRPWLVLPRRSVVLGDTERFACGRGLLNPFLVADADPDTPWLRLPPRYRGREAEIVGVFGLRRAVDCGVSGALRSWLAGFFGTSGGKRTEAPA